MHRPSQLQHRKGESGVKICVGRTCYRARFGTMTCVRHAPRIQIERSPNPSPRWALGIGELGFYFAQRSALGIRSLSRNMGSVVPRVSNRQMPGVRMEEMPRGRTSLVAELAKLGKVRPDRAGMFGRTNAAPSDVSLSHIEPACDGHLGLLVGRRSIHRTYSTDVRLTICVNGRTAICNWSGQGPCRAHFIPRADADPS